MLGAHDGDDGASVCKRKSCRCGREVGSSTASGPKNMTFSVLAKTMLICSKLVTRTKAEDIVVAGQICHVTHHVRQERHEVRLYQAVLT